MLRGRDEGVERGFCGQCTGLLKDNLQRVRIGFKEKR
jgi:hypothetical protein